MNYILLLVVSFFSVLALNAQDCSDLFPIDDNLTYEYTNYDKKGNFASRQERVTSFVEDTDTGKAVQFDVKSYDKKNELMLEQTFDMSCTGDEFNIDFKSILGGLMPNMEGGDIRMDIDGDSFVFPSALTVGQELPPINITTTTYAGDMKLMSATIAIENRKVVGEEQITTKAGTFDCYVITSETSVKMIMSNTTTSKDYIAKGVGLVKNIVYNKKGKETSVTELTAFAK